MCARQPEQNLRPRLCEIGADELTIHIQSALNIKTQSKFSIRIEDKTFNKSRFLLTSDELNEHSIQYLQVHTMAGHKLLAFKSKKETENGLPTLNERVMHEPDKNPSTAKVEENQQPLSPRNDTKAQTLSPVESDSYFGSFRSSRTASIYSLSRLSLSSQLSQLTSLALPNPASLSTSISSIPTAPIASSVLGNAAEQIKVWLTKAKEVLNGLDAEDDVEWAAAGGRDGLGEVDAAIHKFEGLIGVYVKAIEDLQERGDISSVSLDQQQNVVGQMEDILRNWEIVRWSLKNVKKQVEIAMEWEELWNVVLGDIGLEMENLSRLVFEMEETRHKAMLSDPMMDNNGGPLDVQELDTIVEEGDKQTLGHRVSLPSASLVAPNSPMSPGTGIAPDDTRLLALFARMQPLRASLDFLPMTLSNFKSRAEPILPTACQELESRRQTLEKKWKILEIDAEGLRQELGEDRWVVVFRNAGRQALKLCESVERAISKLQESIDVGTQHSNPPLLAKKVEAYEAKKSHYGPAIEKVLSIIEKGVTDRLTVNGEILRLQLDTKARWESIKSEIKDMDLALDDLHMNRHQQLRDSVSSIVSMMDRSGTSAGSVINTPGSSPTSSVVMGPMSGVKRDMSPGMSTSSRRGSTGYNATIRPNGRRNFTMPSGVTGPTQLPLKNPISRSFSSERSSRVNSPSPYAKETFTTPIPGGRRERPALQSDNKPRWNSSPKVDYFEFGTKPRPLPFSTPSPGRTVFRSPHSTGSHYSSALPTPSPLGRSSPAAGSAVAPVHARPRLSSGAQTSFGMRKSSSLSSAAAQSEDWVKLKEKTPPSASTMKRQSIGIDPVPNTPNSPNSPSARTRPQRPSTSIGNSRRISMLPVPKISPYSPSTAGRDNVLGQGVPLQTHGRQTSLGHRVSTNNRDGAAAGGRPVPYSKENVQSRSVSGF